VAAARRPTSRELDAVYKQRMARRPLVADAGHPVGLVRLRQMREQVQNAE